MKVLWRILHRYHEARYRRALRIAAAFKARSEKFYGLIKGETE